MPLKVRGIFGNCAFYKQGRSRKMPGLLIEASCLCGYTSQLSPGSTFEGSFVIAYSKNVHELITEKLSITKEINSES
jgi:hypothetical protein